MFFPPDIAHLRFTRTEVEVSAQQHPAAVAGSVRSNGSPPPQPGKIPDSETGEVPRIRRQNIQHIG